MSRRSSKAIVVGQDGVYKVRSRTSGTSKRKSSTQIDEYQRAPSPPAKADRVIVDDEYGRKVYHTTSRPQTHRQRSYSEPRLPPRQSLEQPQRRREREPIILERAPSPPRRKRASSPRYSRSSNPPTRRREPSTSHAHFSPDETAPTMTRKPRRKSEALPMRAAAPPPPPPYQPPVYAQPMPAQPYNGQPYYGQGAMEPPRQGNIASRFGKKLGNAAIFGVGFTGGADLVNAII